MKMKKSEEVQRLFKLYKDETGNKSVEMEHFAIWMRDRGWPVPIPPDPMELLAKQLKDSICEETRHDEKTGQPYKPHLSYAPNGVGQGTLWQMVDVDEAERKVVLKYLIQRRENNVGDIYQMELIQDHWNNIHPDEEPIEMKLDYKPDIDWKKNGPDQAAA